MFDRATIALGIGPHSSINKFCNANCAKSMYKGSRNSKAYRFHTAVLFTVRYLDLS